MVSKSVCSNIGAKFSAIFSGLAAIVAIFVFVGTAYAAAPLAGTSIGNQASAQYLDQAGVTQNVTSNLVTTSVAQVAALTLTSNLSKTVTAGSQVSYPLTLTNTGNGTDTYLLTENNTFAGAFNFTSVTFYADADGNGVADSTTPITTTTALAPGAVFRFVMVGNVPTTATNGQIDTIVVTAASVLTPTTLATVTDTTTITSNAVINVNKSISATSGAAGSGPYTVTLTYSNTGNTAATAVTLTDALPTGMTYAAGTGRWSVTGAGTTLTDATGAAQGAGPTIDYSKSGTAPALETVTAIIDTVAAGQSGTVTFQVNIASPLAAGALNNTATYAYNDGVAAIPAVNTNTFVFTVNQTALAASNSTAAAPIIVASAAQGSTVSFSNVFTNNGNAPDSFDVAINALLATGTTAFPAGTSYTLYKSDGVTPLVDTNGNSTPDTGIVAAGASYTVVLKATLPAAATGGPYSVGKTATSKLDSTKTANAFDQLTLITASTVDLTNGGVLGAGAGTAAIITTNSTNPGTTTRFTLNANNGSATGDTYNLAVTSALPAGWTVVFRDTAGVVNLTPGTGTVVTNTGVVAGGASKLIYADVTVPAGQAAIVSPGQSIIFRITSPSTGATDVKTDAVIVNTLRSVVLSSNNIGQVFPGGSVVYTHTISNAGNVVENSGGTNTILLALAESQASGFTSIVYLDVNGDNTIDAGDVIVNTAADLGVLTVSGINQSKQLLVKVTALSGVGIGVVDKTTLTATVSGAINTIPAPVVIPATDTTTVISGNMVLTKKQALDVNCNGSLADPGDTAFGTATITTGAVPGACIRYQITATNNGNADVTGLVISDNTPAATTYSITVPAATVPVKPVTAPADLATGTISATVGTLTPSASVVLTFGVKINP
jgi:trimeric autotransporter adhesin